MRFDSSYSSKRDTCNASSTRQEGKSGQTQSPPSYGIGLADSGVQAIQASRGFPQQQKGDGFRESKDKNFHPASQYQLRPANDAYEQQADRLAEKIMTQQPVGEPVKKLNPPAATAKNKKGGQQGEGVNAGIAQEIKNARGKGRPLPEVIRRPAEKALGIGLSKVRLHTGAQAERINRSINAKAAAVNQDIFATKSAADLHSPKSREILLHETVHTMQQKQGTSHSSSHPNAIQAWPWSKWWRERKARKAAERASRGNGDEKKEASQYDKLPTKPLSEQVKLPTAKEIKAEGKRQKLDLSIENTNKTGQYLEMPASGILKSGVMNGCAAIAVVNGSAGGQVQACMYHVPGGAISNEHDNKSMNKLIACCSNSSTIVIASSQDYEGLLSQEKVVDLLSKTGKVLYLPKRSHLSILKNGEVITDIMGTDQRDTSNVFTSNNYYQPTQEEAPAAAAAAATAATSPATTGSSSEYASLPTGGNAGGSGASPALVRAAPDLAAAAAAGYLETGLVTPPTTNSDGYSQLPLKKAREQ